MKKVIFAAIAACVMGVFCASCDGNSNSNGVYEDSLVVNDDVPATTVWHNVIMVEGKDGYYLINRGNSTVKFIAKRQTPEPHYRVLPPDTIWAMYSDGHKEACLVYNDKDEKYVNVPASQENVVGVEWDPCRWEEY